MSGSADTMNTQCVIELATMHIETLTGHKFDVLEVSQPVSPEAAVNLAKIISKLSPLVGNLIEFNVCEFLNAQPEFGHCGNWVRQDPGFPDTVFQGSVYPTPGIEVKAWFPLATEITARFKDSQNAFSLNNTFVSMLAWLPQNLIFGQPTILGSCVVSGASVARARDEHYHNPPDYLVIEPGDTTARTSNLQQTNTNGYKFQGTPVQAREAHTIVDSWGVDGRVYKPSREYQLLLRSLMERFHYRLDTNYAKMDRIAHPEIEAFKATVQSSLFCGLTINNWRQVLCCQDDNAIRMALQTHLGIRTLDAEQIVT